MAIAFHFAARSDTGLVRSENQDSGYAGPHLLLVADGMGGHAGGDIASSTAVGELVRLDDDSLRSEESSTHLARCIARANEELGHLTDQRPELQGMGTTVTALLRTRNKLAVAHIGDSRAYLLRGEDLTQITHDHSFVQTLIDDGRITEDEAATHPQRSLVTRVLTGQPTDEPDLMVREVRPGDRYLVCSDGLSGFVASDTIVEVLRGSGSPAEVADRLVGLALKAGAPDNVTVVVADVVDLTAGGPTPPTQPQVVGAAALRRNGTRAIPLTPAAKAAALRTAATGGGAESDLHLAEEGRRGWFVRSLRLIAAVFIALVVLAGSAYAAYDWSQRQFYVGAHDGRVTVFHGVSQDLGPVSLSEPERVTEVVVDDLPEFYRQKVESTLSVDDLAAADELVAELRAKATACAAKKARGETCDAGPDLDEPDATSSLPTSSGPTQRPTPRPSPTSARPTQ